MWNGLVLWRHLFWQIILCDENDHYWQVQQKPLLVENIEFSWKLMRLSVEVTAEWMMSLHWLCWNVVFETRIFVLFFVKLYNGCVLLTGSDAVMSCNATAPVKKNGEMCSQFAVCNHSIQLCNMKRHIYTKSPLTVQKKILRFRLYTTWD